MDADLALKLSLSTIPEGYPARIANSAAEPMGRTQKIGYPSDTYQLSSRRQLSNGYQGAIQPAITLEYAPRKLSFG